MPYRGEKALALEVSALTVYGLAVATENFNRRKSNKVFLGPRRIQRNRGEHQKRPSLDPVDHGPGRGDVAVIPRGTHIEQHLDRVLQDMDLVAVIRIHILGRVQGDAVEHLEVGAQVTGAR